MAEETTPATTTKRGSKKATTSAGRPKGGGTTSPKTLYRHIKDAQERFEVADNATVKDLVEAVREAALSDMGMA